MQIDEVARATALNFVTYEGEFRCDSVRAGWFSWRSFIDTTAPPQDPNVEDEEEEEDEDDREGEEDHEPAVIREPDEDE